MEEKNLSSYDSHKKCKNEHELGPSWTETATKARR